MENLGLYFSGILFLAFLIVVFVIRSRLKKRLSRSEKKYYKNKWSEIKQEKDLRHAVMSADKLLEKALKRKQFKGTLGEMLKQSKKEYSDLNGVWFAHKIRNKLAHEIDFKLSERDGQEALSKFKKAFNDLGIL